MRGYKILAIVLTLVGLAYVLVPRLTEIVQYRQQSPGFSDYAIPARDQDVIRLNPRQSLRQRLWIPATSINEIHLSIYVPQGKTFTDKPLVAILDDDNVGGGDVVAIPKVEAAYAQGHVDLILHFARFIPVAEEWVWVDIMLPAYARPIYFYRDIDSGAYPGSQLFLLPAHKLMHGVLAFTILSPQLMWLPPHYGLLILAILIAFWMNVLLPKNCL